MSLPISGRSLNVLAACLAALAQSGCSLGLLGGGSPGDRAPVMISAEEARATPARSTTAGFDGLVIADEPVAADAARRVLAKGGSAADAATALYFALSVTYPSAAGLGGGGLCLVHDVSKDRTFSLDFLPRDPQRTGFAAVPGNVKGFEDLHRRLGRLNWAFVVEPAEDLADDGFRVSDALAQRLAGARNVLREDRGLRELFLDGREPLAEGDKLRQDRLASTLSRIQSRGSRALYTGGRAETLVAETGGRLTVEELEQYRPVWTVAQEVETAPGRRFLIPAERTGSGAFLDALFREAAAREISSAAGLRELADGLLKRFGAPNDLPADFGSTAFFVMDGRGDAVGCGLTMNGPFGSGRFSPSTGMVFARAPSLGPFGLSGAFLSPVMMGGGEDGLLTLVVVGAGGPRAAAASVYTAMAARPGTGQTLADVILNNGSGPLDLVNATACAGLAVGNRCELALDPNGFGLAVEAERDE
ncbi:MAG: gamma-glutamyltransferase [Alphaproteobacteria bacterium]